MFYIPPMWRTLSKSFARRPSKMSKFFIGHFLSETNREFSKYFLKILMNIIFSHFLCMIYFYNLFKDCGNGFRWRVKCWVGIFDSFMVTANCEKVFWTRKIFWATYQHLFAGKTAIRRVSLFSSTWVWKSGTPNTASLLVLITYSSRTAIIEFDDPISIEG